MRRKRTVLWTVTAAAVGAMLAGWFTLQSGASKTAGEHPHNKANHQAK
jgi:hypothetical protein